MFALGTINILIKLNRTNKNRYKEILNFLIKHKSINFLAEFSGDFDISFTLIYESFENLNETLLEISDFINNDLEKQKQVIHINEIKFERTDLINLGIKPSKNIDKSIDFSKKRKTFNLTKNEKIILNELSRNSRNKIINISKKTSIAQDMVRIKIKEMEKKGIIIDYTISMDNNFMNYQTYALYLNLRNLSKENLKKLKNYAKQNSNITFCSTTLGEYNVSITAHFSNNEEFSFFLINLRNFFDKDLISYHFELNIKIHKETLIPENFFNIN